MHRDPGWRRRQSALRACAPALLCPALLAVWLLGPGCAATSAPSLSSAYAPDRARAIVRAAERREAGAIHHLVALLEDSDAAVRMYAILALERLTGQTFEYRYYDPEPRRAAAVQRWRQAVRAGQIALSDRAPGPDSQPTVSPPQPPEAAAVTADASAGSAMP